jgi:AraC-like DNA-binding protein
MLSKTVRAANFDGLALLLSDLGGDPAKLFGALGLDADILDSPDRLLEYSQANALLAGASAQCARPDFALRLANRQGPHILGAIAPIIYSAPTVEEAVGALTEAFALHNTGSVAEVFLTGTSIQWTMSVQSESVAAWHHADLAAGVGVGILRHLLGPQWAPELVTFAHRRPKDDRLYRSTFRCKILFDHDQNAIQINGNEWQMSHRAGDRSRYELLLTLARNRLKNSNNCVETAVRRSIWSALRSQAHQIADIAETLGRSARTLQRDLARESTTFRQIHKSVILQSARQYLEETDIPIAQIAQILGFSDQTALTRALRSAGFGTPVMIRSAARIEPPRDCRRPVSSNYAAMGVSSSMA